MNKINDSLGMSYGRACNKLRKEIMFSLVEKLGANICFRCSDKILSSKDFSIDHKIPWRSDNDPIKQFFDIDNIAFSHHSCNCRAASKPHKKYSSARERDRINSWKHRQTDGWKRTVEKRRLQRMALRAEQKLDETKNPYHWIEEDKIRVRAMRNSGMSVISISKETGIACSTLYTFLKT